MIRKEIPYHFTQLKTALIGFANDLTLKINQIHDNIPVYLQQAGDISYVIREKFEETATKDIILKTPRVVFNIDDIQFQIDQYTQQYNKYLYKFQNPETQEEEIWQATGRRIPLNIIVSVDFVCPNFIEYLQNFEVLSVIVARDNVFTYEYAGNTYQAAWVMQSPSTDKPTMDMGGTTRNWSIKIAFDLQVHMLVPVMGSFIRWKDTFIETTQFGLSEGGAESHDLEFNVTKDITEPAKAGPSVTLESDGVRPEVFGGTKIQNTALFALGIEHSNTEQDFADVAKYLAETFSDKSEMEYLVRLNSIPIGEMLIVAEGLTSPEIQAHIRNLNVLGIRSFIV